MVITPPLKYDPFILEGKIHDLENVSIKKIDAGHIELYSKTYNYFLLNGDKFDCNTYNLYGKSIHAIMFKTFFMEFHINCYDQAGKLIIIVIMFKHGKKPKSTKFVDTLKIGQGMIKEMKNDSTINVGSLPIKDFLLSDGFISYEGTKISDKCTKARYYVMIDFWDVPRNMMGDLFGAEKTFKYI